MRKSRVVELCARNPELRIERTAKGDLVVMTPAGGASAHPNLEIYEAQPEHRGWLQVGGPTELEPS